MVPIRPGRASASSATRNVRCASRTGSAKPGPIAPPAEVLVIVIASALANHGQELDARRRSLALPFGLPRGLVAGERFDHARLDLGPPAGVLEKRVEEGGQFRLAPVASGNVAVADDPARQLDGAARHGRLAQVE